MRVGLTGANGFVGSHLAAAICEDGHELRILIRKNSRLHWLDGLSFQTVVGDIRNADNLDEFVAGLDVLIHCAAMTSGNRQELSEANTRGTALLLAALQKRTTALKRFIFISSQEVVGPNPNAKESVDESTMEKPLTDYGRSKLRAENLIKAAGSWLSWTIIRPSPVFGPRDKDTFLFFQAAAARLKPVAFFPGTVSLIYVKNLAHGILQTLKSEKSARQCYMLADNPSYSWHQLASKIERASQAHWLVLPLGKTFLFLVTAVSSAWSFISGTRVILNRQKYLMMTAPNLSVSSDKARQDFYTETVPSDVAFKDTYDWYKQYGWL